MVLQLEFKHREYSLLGVILIRDCYIIFFTKVMNYNVFLEPVVFTIYYLQELVDGVLSDDDDEEQREDETKVSSKVIFVLFWFFFAIFDFLFDVGLKGNVNLLFE